MLLQLCVISFAVLASAYSAVTIDDCPPNLPRDKRLRAHGNSCYLFVLDHEREFNTAERECEARRGHLVIIRDLATQHFLYQTLRQEFHFGGVAWIGLSDARSEDHFVWVDGSAARFTYWASDQPGLFGSLEDCVAMDISDGGRWHDYQCNDVLFIHNRQTFICEYPIVKHATSTSTMPTTTPTSTTLLPTTPQPTTTTLKTVTTKPTTTTSTTTTTTTTTTTPTTTTTTTPTTTTTTTTPVPTTPPPKQTTPQSTRGTTPAQTKPDPTTGPTTTPDEAACPPFECSMDCGLSGYKVDGNNCLMCQCEE